MSRGQGPVLALAVVAVGVFAAGAALWTARPVATDGAVVATGGGGGAEPQTPAAPARPRPTHFWVHCAEDDPRPWTAPDGEVIEGWRMRSPERSCSWLDPDPDSSVAGDAATASADAQPFRVQSWMYGRDEPRGPKGWWMFVDDPDGIPADAFPDPALAGTWVMQTRTGRDSGTRWTLHPDGRVDPPRRRRTDWGEARWAAAGGLLYLDERPAPDSRQGAFADRFRWAFDVMVLDADGRSGWTSWGTRLLRRAD